MFFVFSDVWVVLPASYFLQFPSAGQHTSETLNTMSTMLRSKTTPNIITMGPPPQKCRPKEPLPNGTKRQQRTSPRLANRVMNNDASSTRPSAPQPKPAQSFKERLFARPKKKKEPTPEPAKIELHSRPQTTIAPFFKKIQAAFGEETQPSKQQRRQKQQQQQEEQDAAHVPTLPLKRQPTSTVQTRKRKRDSPAAKVQEETLSAETEEMLNELKGTYVPSHS